MPNIQLQWLAVTLSFIAHYVQDAMRHETIIRLYGQ